MGKHTVPNQVPGTVARVLMTNAEAARQDAQFVEPSADQVAADVAQIDSTIFKK